MISKKRFTYSLIIFLITLPSCVTDDIDSRRLLEEEVLLTSHEKNQLFIVYGHKNPDLDSYGSAYAYASLLRRQGLRAEAYALGKPNLETQYVLEALGEKPLPILEKVPKEAKVILLDHNETRQSIKDVDPDQISQIIDHHRLDMKTADTISLEIEKVGSTATLIYKRFQEKQITPNQVEAGFLLAAVLSDTRLLTSPTTTSLDKEACEDLAKRAGRDYKHFGKELLLAGTKSDHLSEQELYHGDLKQYLFDEEKVSIGVVSTTDIPKVLKRKEAFKDYMEAYRKKENLSASILLITDLLENNSYAIVVGDKTRFHKAFAQYQYGQDYLLKAVVSRKRQVVPQLEKAL